MISIAPDYKNVTQVCDWLEMFILCDSLFMSKSKLQSILVNNGVSNEDTFIADVFSELDRRQRMMGDSSVFSLDENDVMRRNGKTWRDVPEYVMCLIFSLQGVKKIKGDDDGTKLFERVGKCAIESYLDGRAILLGFPNDCDLNTQIEEFCKESNEIKSKDRIPASTDKDKGVDIIGWKPHNDGRSNQVVLLIQAAAGYHWGLKKPVSKNVWSDFIRWSAPFNIGIILAGTLDEISFSKARDDYDLVFDRIRIFISYYLKRLTIDPDLQNAVIKWCEKELNLSP